MSSIIKVDQIQSDTGNVTFASAIPNIGIGKTVNTNWSPIFNNRVEIGTSGQNASLAINNTNGNISLTTNAFFNGTNWIYEGTGFSTNYNSSKTGGSHTFNCADSGSSGTTVPYITGAIINKNGIGLGATNPSSGTGIAFPASQNASADPNTLDDYEEGTWTPVDGSGAGLSFSNTSGNCFYTKVGRTVTVTFRLTYPSTASGSAAVVGGLPFLAIDTNVNVQAVCFGEQNFSAGAMGLVQDNNTTFLFLTTNGTSVTVHTNANVSGKDFRGTATYQAA